MNGNYYPTDEDRQAIEEAFRERGQPLTVEAIEQNPWHAVAREVGRTASTELSAAVVEATEQVGERAMKWGDRAEDSEERKAWHAVAAMAARRGEEAAMAQERAIVGPEPEMSRDIPADTLSFDAMRKDPWNAVRLDIPDDASIELLGQISQTARELRVYAEGRAEAAQDAGNLKETERWVERAEAADFRLDDASVKLAEARAQEAWRAPAFSYETISADAWTAVHLPIPEQAEPELLAYARNWASDLGRYAERGGREGEFARSVFAEKFTREQNIEGAAERVGALDARLEQAREQMAERHSDEWELHGAYGVEELPSQLEHRQAGESARLEEIIAWSKGTSVNTGGGLEVRLSSEEMDRWLEAQRTVEAAQDMERSRSHGEFLSGTLIGSHFGESLARTAEMLMKEIIGYFVPEPALTPEQARLAERAHSERGEAMEFEMARRDNAAALDRVNYEIDRHRPHVRPEEPVRPDSLYERYPGLTIDENDGRARQVEADRAFYDTGVERSRSRGI
jgi:hypothetical protein